MAAEGNAGRLRAIPATILTVTQSSDRFRQAAADTRERGLVRDLFAFLKENKKWWVLPIVVTMLLLAVAAWLSSSAAAPFIYTLF